MLPAEVSTVNPNLERLANSERMILSALRIYSDVLEHPDQGRSRLSAGFRRERSLHSNERRFLREALTQIIRHSTCLDTILGACADKYRPLQRWLGWLVHLGISTDVACQIWGEHTTKHPPPFAHCRHLREYGRKHLEAMTPVSAVAWVSSLPLHIASELYDRFGKNVVPFLIASNSRAPLTIRTNMQRITRDQLMARLEEEGIGTKPTKLSPWGLIITQTAHLQSLDTFKEGLFEIQDESSQLCAALMRGEGGVVIDLCAGAGGKSLAYASIRQDTRVHWALDIRPKALRQLNTRAQRAQVSHIRTKRIYPKSGHIKGIHQGSATCVLVDAPCSGLGTLRRHPELRLRYSVHFLADAQRLQTDLLNQGAQLVTKGGTLVYSTCSVLPSECEGRINHFLATHPEFQKASVKELLPVSDPSLVTNDNLLLCPQDHNTDGFFAAVLRKTAH